MFTLAFIILKSILARYMNILEAKAKREYYLYMDELQLKNFRTSFKLFWLGQIFLFIGCLYFDGRFKFLPDWLILLAIFKVVGIVLTALALFRTRNINREFFLSLVTLVIYAATNILRSVCTTSTDEFYINWAKGLDWSIQLLECITYIYYFLGCYKYFVSLGHTGIGKKSKIAAIIFVSLFILERLTVFLMFFNGIRANIMANRVFTFGQIIINVVIYIYLVVITSIIRFHMKKKRKEAISNEQVN